MKRKIIKKVAMSALVLAVSTSVIVNMTAYELLKKIGLKA